MILTKKDKEIFYKLIGHGNPFFAQFIFFGNEHGLANTNINDYLIKLKYNLNNNKIIYVKDHYLWDITNKVPQTSIYIKFISLLLLSLETNSEEWFKPLNQAQKIQLNNFIKEEYSRKVCTINLRPLPRSSEANWIYENIDKKSYLKEFNFKLKSLDNSNSKRIKILLEILTLDTIKIGVGDKKNKEQFFKKSLNINFESYNNFLINKEHKIILSDYFDYRSGIKLKGLYELYLLIRQTKF